MQFSILALAPVVALLFPQVMGAPAVDIPEQTDGCLDLCFREKPPCPEGGWVSKFVFILFVLFLSSRLLTYPYQNPVKYEVSAGVLLLLKRYATNHIIRTVGRAASSRQ